MSMLLPLIQDLLPMIMPSSVHITKGSDIIPPTPPTDQVPELQRGEGSGTVQDVPPPAPLPEQGVVSKNAIVDKTDKMCAAVLIAKPKSFSSIHHNAEQDTIVYAVSGKGVLATLPEDDDGDPKLHELSPGDFAFVPAWTEHQVVNESEHDVVWVVIRSGPQPTVVNLSEWGGPEVRQ